MFRELNRELRQTIVLVTNNPYIIAYADRLIEMRDGVIVYDNDLVHELENPEGSGQWRRKQ